MRVGLGTFLRCIKNERYIDRESIERLSLSGDLLHAEALILPRPIKTYALSLLFSRLSAYGVFVFLIVPILMFFSVRGMLYFLSCLHLKKVAGFHGENVVVGTHDKVLALFQDNVKGAGHCYVDNQSFKQDVDFRSLWRMLFVVFLWRLILVRKAYRSIKINSKFCYWSEIFLNSYVFEELVVFSSFVDGFKGRSVTFYVANHYDRWVVILDRHRVNYGILQHGRLASLDLPYKIKNLFSFHYQDRLSFELFLRNLTSVNRASVRSYPLVNKLSLSHVGTISNFDGPHVLYIGEPHLRAFEEKLLEVLLKDARVAWLYKPHPRFRSFSFRFEPHSNFFRVSKDFFPDVSLVLFVGSTLGFEYKSIGVPVVQLKAVVHEDVPRISHEIDRVLSTGHA